MQTSTKKWFGCCEIQTTFQFWLSFCSFSSTALETVIGMPSNLFYSVAIPVWILVLKSAKNDDVLFINASQYFEKGKRQKRLLPEHIEKIIDTYQYRKTEDPRYSKRVSMEEIREKRNYNPNISRYVSTATAQEKIDLSAVHSKLQTLKEKIVAAKKNTQ